MDVSNDVKPRVSHMSQGERNMLVSLIEDELILNNNETSEKVVLPKGKAWDRLEEKHNAMNLGPRRTKKQLYKAWERLKKR